MEKIKADILITGDLICKELLTGGGKIYSSKNECLDEYFDIHDSVVITGDVVVDRFYSKEYTVVVTGSIVAKGGSDGSL